MANQLDHEWFEAQKIVISIDLIAAAKKHLKFLEAVDNNGKLYDGRILEKAIFRYKYCWLSLFAKHIESEHPKCQLVVPLDIEWIWHCHRLNPVRYMADCKELFGRILDPNYVVVSSIENACKKQTEEIWNKQYLAEPYELDFSDLSNNDTKNNILTDLASTNYDLISAVKRQSSFYHKVLESTKIDDLHLAEAVQRYKGFLYLVRKNMEMNLKNACVPTRDIDLMWHTHQLYPLSYCKDSFALVCQVLHHDDTDNDQSKGGKLDVGITNTTKQWGEMFGSAYWRVGSMSKGTLDDIKGRKLSARCWCLAENVERENMTGRCWCLAENMKGAKLTARCWCIAENMERENMTGENMTGRCWCLAENMKKDNMNARCWCIAENKKEENMSGRCWCIAENMEGAKLTARCWCIAENMKEKNMTARCWCIAENMEEDKLTMACQSIANSMNEEQLTTKICITEGMHTRRSPPQSSSVVFVEILVEIMEVINLPVTQKGNIVMCISKKQPDMLPCGKRKINICTEIEETQVVVLRCEPNGELLFEIYCDSNQYLVAKIQSKLFGMTSVSLTDLMKSVSMSTTLKRLEFGSGTDPITLSVAISTTPPSIAQYYALQMVDENTPSKEKNDSGKFRNKMNEWSSNQMVVKKKNEDYDDIGVHVASGVLFMVDGCGGKSHGSVSDGGGKCRDGGDIEI